MFPYRGSSLIKSRQTRVFSDALSNDMYQYRDLWVSILIVMQHDYLMRFYLSKFVLRFAPLGAMAVTGATAFLVWLTYVLSTRYVTSHWFLFALWSIDAFLLFVSFTFWQAVVRMIRHAAEPVISFEANGIRYQLKTGDTVFTPFLEILGVEVEAFGPRLGGGHILIHKSNQNTDSIYICNLNALPEDVFFAFRERLPHLFQPHSTIMRLIYAA